MSSPIDTLAVIPAEETAVVAPVQEIFSSFQGEGPYVGHRQVFVRFAHCHLKCGYCDTPMHTPTGECHVEDPPGSGHIRKRQNPLSPQQLLEEVSPLLVQTPHIGVSFTGGEPLLYHRFLLPLFQSMQAHWGETHPQLIYLETSGTQPAFLAPLLPYVNVIAMDIKLPSATLEAPQFENHKAFYQLIQEYNCTAKRPVECFIKLVFNANIQKSELEAVHEIVRDPGTVIFLQPETSLVDRKVHLPAHVLFETQETLSRYHLTRVVPQTHKMLDIL